MSCKEQDTPMANITLSSGPSLRPRKRINIRASLGLNAETQIYVNKIVAAGGLINASSQAIANGLSRGIANSSFNAKMIWLLPLLGQNLIAGRFPLRDTLNVGAVANTAFTDEDFIQGLGLQGNGTTKILDTGIQNIDLNNQGAGDARGGLGYWENNIDFGGTSKEPMGVYNAGLTTRYVLDLRSTFQAFRWGVPPSAAQQSTTAVNGHYYGQRSSATSREIFLNGLSIATNSSADLTDAGVSNIKLMGCNQGGSLVYWKGRCAVSYMTDGMLSSAQVVELHSILQTYLITPTGR